MREMRRTVLVSVMLQAHLARGDFLALFECVV